MNKHLINERFDARFDFEEELQPIRIEVLVGWFCCAALSVVAWALIIWFVAF